MKAILIVSILFLTISSIASADKWTKQDCALEATWIILHIIDWGTTLDIENNPTTHYEAGPAKFFIGEHPNEQAINIYMGLSTVLHPVITNFLPRRVSLLGVEFNPRTIWQGVSIGASAACVVNNFNLGLKVAF